MNAEFKIRDRGGILRQRRRKARCRARARRTNSSRNAGKTSPERSSARCWSRRSRWRSRPFFEFAEARRHSLRCASLRRHRAGAWSLRHGVGHASAGDLGPRPPQHAAALRQGDARSADDRQPHGRVRHACPCRGAGPCPRVDIMNRMQPYLPLLLALSTSSPFWQAQRTGLLGYRLAAYRELPRTGPSRSVRRRRGLPALHRYAGGGPGHRELQLCVVGDPPIPEASDARASRRRQLHPARRTLAIAALYRCLVRHLVVELEAQCGQTGASRAITDENGWRAQRYGIHGSFVDEAPGAPSRSARCSPRRWTWSRTTRAPSAASANSILPLDIARGTSADQQLTLYTEGVGRGLSNRDALAGVVDWLSAETVGAPTGPLH